MTLVINVISGLIVLIGSSQIVGAVFAPLFVAALRYARFNPRFSTIRSREAAASMRHNYHIRLSNKQYE
jgi:hypothetical protein